MKKGILGTLLLLLPFGAFGGPLTQLNTRIELTSDPLVGLTTLAHTFKSLGYRMQIDTIVTRNSVSQIEAVLIGQKPLNPAVLAENLQEAGIKLTYGRMNEGKMELGIDATAAVWNLQILGADEGTGLERSSTPYWFRVTPGQAIRIEPPYGAKWYPDVSVMDASMRILFSERSEQSSDELKFPLPDGAYYLKISNTYGMKAMKEGMWVESMSEGR